MNQRGNGLRAGAIALGVAAVACGASTGDHESIGVARSALASPSVFGFDALGGWRVSSGRVALNTATKTQGPAALAVTAPVGYTTLVSSPVSNLDIVVTGLTAPGSTMQVDLLLPTQQPNRFYLGALQLFFSIPSLGLFNQFVGQVELTGLPLGKFQTITFSLDSVRSHFVNVGYEDLSFTLALNAPAQVTSTYLFDNFRVGGPNLFHEFPLPNPACGPEGLVDVAGGLWFTESVANRIGRLKVDGSVVEYVIPTPASRPRRIAQDANFNGFWFTEFDANKIGFITPTGAITEYPIPTPNAKPLQIVSAINLNMWFNETGAGKIGEIAADGTITEFALPGGQPATSITGGSDGRLWFTQATGVGRIDFQGNIQEAPLAPGLGPAGIEVDGPIWFTEFTANALGTTGYPPTTVGQIPIWTPDAGPLAIVPGVVASFFTEQTGNKIGAVDSSGVITEWSVPTPSSLPTDVSFGVFPELGVYFTEFAAGKIGVLSLTPVP